VSDLLSQRIMRVGVPLAALAYAGPDAARCDAAAEPYRPRVALPPPLPEHRLLMMRALDALADELLTMLRAVYLVSDGVHIKLRGNKRQQLRGRNTDMSPCSRSVSFGYQSWVVAFADRRTGDIMPSAMRLATLQP